VNTADGNGIWLVRDIALGGGEHDLELNWHFASDVALHEIGGSKFAASRAAATEASLRLFVPDHAKWSAGIASTRISPAYGRFEPAGVLQVKAHIKLPAEIATALLSGTHATAAEGNQSGTTMHSTHEAAVQIYELHDDGDNYSFYFARDKQPWSVGPWSSDAEVLCARITGEKLEQLIVIGGSSVTWQGEALLNASGPFQFFEWRRQDGLVNSAKEKFSTTPAFQELISSLRDPSPVSHSTSTYAEKH
jgi:hypothetical protein